MSQLKIRKATLVSGRMGLCRKEYEGEELEYVSVEDAQRLQQQHTADLRAAQIRALEWAATCYDDVDLREQIDHLKAGGALI